MKQILLATTQFKVHQSWHFEALIVISRLDARISQLGAGKKKERKVMVFLTIYSYELESLYHK